LAATDQPAAQLAPANQLAMQWAFFTVPLAGMVAFWLFGAPTRTLQYPVATKKSNEKQKGKRVALAASFNPPHLGHITILQQV